jgi:hypothetical protein
MPEITKLLPEVVCPNCWAAFPPEASYYIATEPSLVGDRRLGGTVAQRFLPTRFHPDGRAIDPRGGLCHELACPHCHLDVPRSLLECPTLFASVFGAPSSGKSYLLTAMTHQLRQTLPRWFATSFTDADPRANASLHDYENTLFIGGGEERWATLPKTDVAGDRYRSVDFGSRILSYPQPYFFHVSPAAGHRHGADPAGVARALCLYDNAGESFEPGQDHASNPVTQHLARSGILLYVFDPLQEPTFRQAIGAAAAETPVDAQVQGGVVYRQDVMLAEVARRIRQFHGLPASARHNVPLVVAVTKFDAWQRLAGGKRLADPWAARGPAGPAALRMDVIDKVSGAVRALLIQHAPAIVATAESFVEPRLIRYVPVSATGGAPNLSSDGGLRFRAGTLAPMWAEIPVLASLATVAPGLVDLT